MSEKRRVTQQFDAKHVNARRRERFAPGELLTVVDGAELPLHSTFTRINGLRPQRGVECHYIIESAELNAKTEVHR